MSSRSRSGSRSSCVLRRLVGFRRASGRFVPTCRQDQLTTPTVQNANIIVANDDDSLRQLRAARQQLRDFNAAARQQLGGSEQLAALEAGAAALASTRADLDAVAAFLR